MRLSAVRAAVRGALALPARLSHGRRLSVIRRSDSRTPIVSFGGVLEGRRLIHGGAVKLIHLRDALPGTNKRSTSSIWSAARRRSLPRIFSIAATSSAFPSSGIRTESRTPDGPARIRIGTTTPCGDCARGQSTSFTKAHFAGIPQNVSWAIPTRRAKFSSIRLTCRNSTPQADLLPASPLRLLTLGTHGYRERVLSTIRCARALKDSGTDCSLTIAGRLGWPWRPR